MEINKQGFSLIELMVVIGIVSILATVVMPVYSSYSFRTRQVEAKASLAGLYTAQKTFHIQYGAYHSSFQAVGFEPEGFVHYNVGFGAPGFPAGPAQGFDLVVDLTRINSQSFCGGVGGANVAGNRCTFVHPTPALSAALSLTADLFFAGAAINKSIYGVQIDPVQIPGQMVAASPLVKMALGSLFSEAHASGSETAPPPDFGVSAGQELWVIDSRKKLSRHQLD